MSLLHLLGNSCFEEIGCSEKCHEHYEIASSASSAMNILYSPLKGSWLKKAAPSSSAKVAL